MKMLRPAIALSLVLVSLTAALPVKPTFAVASASTTPQSIEQVVRYGTTSPLQPASISSSNASGNAAAPAGAAQLGARLSQVNRAIPRPVRSTSAPTMALPAPPSNGVAGRTPGVTGFNGITNRDQQLAGSGQYVLSQQFLEPPDQGLCAGNGSVIEAVNLALRVHTMAGTATSPVVALNQFFRVPPWASRTDPTVYGPFLSDPKCYYDSSTARWFLSTLEISTDPATGAFTDTSFQLLAVSQSSNPLGTWNLYRFETTDGSGATPGHPRCPCFGDQPLLGADQHGVYVTTNEFPITGPGFNGSQVYALSKAQLVSGTASQVVHINAGALPTPDQGGIWYSIQPATSPGGQFETANNGTEYFLSALEFFGTGDNRIAAWALMNTSSLDSSTPAVSLTNAIVGSENYIGVGPGGASLKATQKPGPTPLADFFNFYFHTNNKLEPVQGNDDRMNQVVFAAGKLWSGVNTAENGTGASANVGIAYFIVTPSSADGTLTATMTNQGYVSAGRDNVMFPSIGVTPAGKGVMSFSLIGPDFYPSAAYALVDAVNGAGNIHIANAGAAPDDGFTGYFSPICPPGPCNNVVGGRWGDYSAAVADEQGRIWIASEYIPNSPRLLFANWGTFISSVTP